MSVLKSANIVLCLAPKRADFQGDWLKSHRSFSFSNNNSPDFEPFRPFVSSTKTFVSSFPSLPTHQHRDAEIMPYLLFGEMTYPDSIMWKAGSRRADTDTSFSMKRGDVIMASTGSVIAHSKNEHKYHCCQFL